MSDPIHRLVDRLARRIAYEVKNGSPLPDTREHYLALAVLRDRYDKGDRGLSAAELRVFSQNGEDGVLAEIFCKIGVDTGFFVEFGVESGVECNTRFLAEVVGWSGVYFEPEPNGFQALDERLRNRPDITRAQRMVSPDNVNELFATVGVPEEFDLLSIDVDGQDYWIWEALEQSADRFVLSDYVSRFHAVLLDARDGDGPGPTGLAPPLPRVDDDA